MSEKTDQIAYLKTVYNTWEHAATNVVKACKVSQFVILVHNSNVLHTSAFSHTGANGRYYGR